jgi:hypothetical protein
VRDEDLQWFAPAASLRAKMLQSPGQLTDDERMELLDRARHVIAREASLSLEDAGRVMHETADRGDLEVRCGEQFAAVFMWGRVVHCATRAELRGVCHPELN